MNVTITEEQIAFYRENGFVQIDNIITPEEMEELRQYADEAILEEHSHSQQPDKENRGYFRVLNQRFNTWRDHGGMAKFSLHSRFADTARQLSGQPGVRLFHDHLLFKMPGDSKPTPWHQDLPYWPMNESGALSMWLPLDDVNEDNGCMMFVPKSHKIGKLQAIDLIEPQDIYEFVHGEEQETRQKPVIVRMKSGSCTFHDGLTFHYAHSNTTDKPRRVLAVIYMPDGITYSGKPHILADYARGLDVGKPISGPLFPKLA
ncbi:Ectoine hydroxylase-related dioxygenase, phytanoyl-CoA dioxygenase (PhyH) family [Paenibacillus sp. yr247]|uniref:phytanoyl-CoA dioxygenase family protein n=1 Tax=Paenibacillus sp. yr247 TaxID=1761880 RepID=UPI00088C4939|nr:phytanoyl-CoA dioxygenase family protein [Paenibacillus sp. yr247]SDO19234.1 Ectoine hydroxylase-related dioxygenase, phytanoyl-CoA dioxygenase (PhyH) family [Paenibacillus sp. yr247]